MEFEIGDRVKMVKMISLDGSVHYDNSEHLTDPSLGDPDFGDEGIVVGIITDECASSRPILVAFNEGHPYDFYEEELEAVK